MKLRRPQTTGSKFHRVWKCPASLVLPQNTNEDLDAKWEPARGRGKGVHRYLERVRAVGVDQALAEVPADLAILCRALDVDKLPTHLATEVAYAYNWREGNARELGRNLAHRDYDSLGIDWSWEIPCTLDVVGWATVMVSGCPRKRAYVGDYKTGHTAYPRPGVFGQTMLGVLCACLVMECDDGVVELIKIDDDGESYAIRDVVDEWAIEAFAREVAETMDKIPDLQETFHELGGGALDKHQGAHCDHCPAYKDCSAKVALVRALPMELIRLGARREPAGDFELKPVVVGKDKAGKPVTELQLQLEPGVVTVRNAAAVWEACERVEAMCKRLRQEVVGMAWNEPVALSDGRVIERYATKRRAVDGRIAAQVLERRYGREEAMKAVDIKVSLDAIRERVVANLDTKATPRPKITTRNGDGVLDQVLDEIKGLNGLTVNVGEECKPHQPRKK